jgi:hypothetical protein
MRALELMYNSLMVALSFHRPSTNKPQRTCRNYLFVMIAEDLATISEKLLIRTHPRDTISYSASDVADWLWPLLTEAILTFCSANIIRISKNSGHSATLFHSYMTRCSDEAG